MSRAFCFFTLRSGSLTKLAAPILLRDWRPVGGRDRASGTGRAVQNLRRPPMTLAKQPRS
jgi:hypothetical protein